MAIEDITVKTDIMEGDGDNTIFPFDFRIVKPEDLQVYVKIGDNDYELKTLDTDYELDLITSTTGEITAGNIVYPKSGEPLTENDKIYAIRKTPDTQLESSDTISFKSKDIERALDKLTMRAQEVTDIITNYCEKADNDLSNLTDDGKTLAASFGLPSAVVDTLTLGASGDTYTAPANGYFCIQKRAGDGGYKYLAITVKDSDNNTIYGVERQANNDAMANMSVLIPVQKDFVAKIEYNATGTTELFEFIYAEGSKQEGE